jgi:hypothetical protein
MFQHDSKKVKIGCQAVLVSFCVDAGRKFIWIPLSIDKYFSNTDTRRQETSVVQILSSHFETHFII